MNSNLAQAISLLEKENYTCVLCKDKEIYTSKLHGVLPLMNWLSQGTDLKNAIAADKVVGKAAAFLYVNLGVKEVYAEVMSSAAIHVFQTYGITFSYKMLVEKILNRTGTELCPMEQAVKDIEAPAVAFGAIKQTAKFLQTLATGKRK